MKNLKNVRFGTLCLIVLTAGIIRLIPHPVNFSPIGAMALFGGVYFGKKWQSFLVPLVALFISDLVVNFVYYREFVVFHDTAIWVYCAFALNVIISSLMVKKVKVASVAKSSVTASIAFFIITNFGVWALPGIMNLYPHSAAGLITCYMAGIPYFWFTLSGDLFYSALLFGIFELAKRSFPVLAVCEN